MHFELKDVLGAAGPTASLIFAAWIFLSFLQERYTGAYERYRALVSEYRERHGQGQLSEARERSIRAQVLLYKRRCEQMRTATNTGVASAIVLIVGVIAGVVGLVAPALAAAKYVSVGAVVLGLFLVIVAATYVPVENTSLERAINAEIEDVPELASPAAGRR